MGRKFIMVNGRRHYLNGFDMMALKNQAAGNTVSKAMQGGMSAWGKDVLRNTAAARKSAPRPATGLSPAGGSSAAQLKADQQRAFLAAQAANKARENEIRQKYAQRYSAVMGTLQGMGEQTRKNILEMGQRREGEAAQSAISRGLSMGSVLDSLKNSVREGTDRNLGNLDESLRAQRLGYESSLRKEEADFLERINDVYPNQGIYAQALSSYGAGQGEMGGAAGAPTGPYGSAYGAPMSVGHAFYTGKDPRTGAAVTQRTSNSRMLHSFSARNAVGKKRWYETPEDYAKRKRAAGIAARNKPIRSMRSRARAAVKASKDRANSKYLSQHAPVRKYSDIVFGPTPTIPQDQLPTYG